VLQRLSRVPTWAWALAFAVLLCLPRLGSFGLWEPWELNIADRARKMAEKGSLTDASLGGAQPVAPPLATLLPALGVKTIGATELGVRLYGALAAVGALMAIYWAGVGLLRRRAALLAVLAIGVTPLFALSARQLISDMPLVASLALSLGGLGRFAWPAHGRRRLLDAAVGVAGLVLGHLAGGALSGVALPCLSLLGALLIGAGLVVQRPASPVGDGAAAPAPPTPAGAPAPIPAPAPEPAPVAGDDLVTDGTEPLAALGQGPHLPAGSRLGRALFGPSPLGIAVLAPVLLVGLTLLVVAFTGLTAGKYTSLLGGAPKAGAPVNTFEHLVRELGFGLFPWSALAFFALGRPFVRLDDEPGARTNHRLAFVQTYLVLFAALGLALSTYLMHVLGEPRYVALAAVALAIGAFLDEALEGNRSEPVVGLLIAAGTLVIGRDFYLAPEELASIHLVTEKARWPQTIAVGYIIVGLFAVPVAAGIIVGLAARGRALGKLTGPDLTGAPRWRRRVDRAIVLGGRYGLQAAVAVAVVFGFWLTQGIVPRLSAHFSFKPAMESYAKFAKEGEKIGRYRVEGRGASFYSRNTTVDLPTQDRVVDFLRAPERVFALVSADELASLDTALKLAGVPYVAVDASSSRFLLISNKLGAGESDGNPLRQNVWMAPTNPQASGGTWNPAEKPPWTWRVPAAATFADSIELVGANYPQSVRRPGTIPLELIFRVKARPPGTYKIFVHFDGPATPRLIGDHDPVNKTFATSYWLPGEYVKDVYHVDVPLMTTPAGIYNIYLGFWPGGEGRRLKITQGANDGQDRYHLGAIEVK
jgi:hypothetical protein